MRCGKLGHPKTACTGLDGPSGQQQVHQVIQKGFINGYGKDVDIIQKTFKTMGKAMSQVLEEIGAFGDDNSIGAQSCVQVEITITIGVAMHLQLVLQQ